MPSMPAIPRPDMATAWQAALTLGKERYLLAALQTLHDRLGDVFRLPLPGFTGVFLVGPEANRFVLAESCADLRWRADDDPVTRLLRHGILVEDGAVHDELRTLMSPALHKKMFDGYIEAMWRSADRVADRWQEGARIELVAEMRRIAMLVLMETLFKEDFMPHIEPLWGASLRTIQYISPGPWLVWPGIPRPGYQQALAQMDSYFYELIARRRAQSGSTDDLLGGLIAAGMSDGLIRDQLLTMFIAGHDTSTAQLAWSIYLLTTHPEALARVQTEVDSMLGAQLPTYPLVKQLDYLDAVLKETLRLYPPIHLGSRIAATDLSFQGYTIPAGTRVLYSLYLTHRQKHYWPNANQFMPERFAKDHKDQSDQRTAYSYLPFGGGPRNCIGAAFAQVEARMVLARLLQRFELRYVGGTVRPLLRATLEPHPGVLVEVHRR